jgi:hypothetical protein
MTNLRTLAVASLAMLAAASLGACKPNPANSANSAMAANIATNEATTTDAAPGETPKDSGSKTTSKTPD